MTRAAEPKPAHAMYRRFAVITLVLTLAVAMLAEGGQASLEAAPQAAYAPPAPIRAPASAHPAALPISNFDDELLDIEGAFGQPTQLASGESDGSDEAPAPNAIPAGYLASLDESERRQVIAEYNESRLSPAELARMDEASRLRSGASSSLD